MSVVHRRADRRHARVLNLLNEIVSRLIGYEGVNIDLPSSVIKADAGAPRTIIQASSAYWPRVPRRVDIGQVRVRLVGGQVLQESPSERRESRG